MSLELPELRAPRAPAADLELPPNAAEFVAKFERYWSAPSVLGMRELLTDDVVLAQPLSRTTRGLADGQAAFAKIFRAVPDLRARVDDYCTKGSVLYIDFRLSGTYAGKFVEWPAVDRIRLRGSYACERVSYFDPSPIVRALMSRPSAWFGALRASFGFARR